MCAVLGTVGVYGFSISKLRQNIHMHVRKKNLLHYYTFYNLYHIVTSPTTALAFSHFHGGRPSLRARGRRQGALTARCDSRGCPTDAHLRPHAEGAGRISSTSLLCSSPESAAAEGQERDLVPGIPCHQRRLEGDQGRCAGCLRRAGARLSPSVTVDLLCLLSVPAIHAAPGQLDREGLEPDSPRRL